MKSNLGLIAVALIVGLSIGLIIDRPVMPSSVSQNEKVSSGIKRLQGIADTDIEEYYRLKTLEERYLKADEVLAKIMAIFLADLGIRMNPEVLRAVKDSAAIGVTAANVPDAKDSQLISDSQEKTNSGIKSAPNNGHPVKQAATNPEDRLATRASTRDLRHDHEIEDFLRDSQIEEFDQAIKQSSSFANKSGALDQLNGYFAGVANVIRNGRPAVWEVEFELKGQIINGKFQGDRILKLSENGKVFSNSSGNGNLGNDFREIPIDPEAIIASAGPDTFLQIYYLKSIDSLVGNVLKKENISEGYKTIGSFKLLRK